VLITNGDDAGLLIASGLSLPVVLFVVSRADATRHPVLRGTIAGLASVVIIYLVIALLSLAINRTEGYPFATWLVAIGIGGLVAAGFGLAEGLVASLIFRLFSLFR